jgi:hypothetical protein
MMKLKSILIGTVLTAALTACASLALLKTSGDCIPSFPNRDGWYGGDGAYSIPLDARRTLWLFGDTFVSDDEGRKDRVGMDIVMGNTLAVSTCAEKGNFSIEYFMKRKGARFLPFFGEKEILWPQDPFIADGTLYIPLLIIEPISDQPAPFNFKIAGHKMARIKDFSDADPRKWPVEYAGWTSALPPGIEALAPTSVVHERYVYFFSLYRYKDRHIEKQGNILTRIPVNSLEKPAGAFEYLHNDGRWRKEWSPDAVKIIFDFPLSELSVRFREKDRKWLAVYMAPSSGGPTLLIQSSERLDGSWSPPVALMKSIPEMDADSPLYHPQTFCYAGKEHYQFSYQKDLMVTYVCNSSEDPHLPSGPLRRHLFLYRPIVNRILCPLSICP